MCGIFGCLTLNGKNPDEKLITKAINSLRHRGPDDYGIAKFENVIFGHRRLSIIDLNHKSC